MFHIHHDLGCCHLIEGHKDGLSHEEYNWNYVQSSIRMCIEWAFGLLKGRWRILMKRIDTQLEMVPGIVTACIILHNLCTIQKDEFLKDWIREAQNEVHDSLQDPIFKNSLSQQALADDCLLALGGLERTCS
jgi:hypothetical protein